MSDVILAEQETQPDLSTMDIEVQRLQREHDELKVRLGELNERLYLSPVEEVEKKNLQKLKLAKKDRIATLSSLQPIKVGHS